VVLVEVAPQQPPVDRVLQETVLQVVAQIKNLLAQAVVAQAQWAVTTHPLLQETEGPV
jgi:hypothetical protein